jgi:hypothetical protein
VKNYVDKNVKLEYTIASSNFYDDNLINIAKLRLCTNCIIALMYITPNCYLFSSQTRISTVLNSGLD